MKINRVQIYTLCLVLFVFQPVIEKIIPFFKYYDESIVLFVFIIYVMNIFRKKKNGKRATAILLWMLLFSILGLLGNILSSVNQSVYAIIQDFLSNVKMVFFAVSAQNIRLTNKQQEQLEDNVANLVHVIFVIMFVTTIISQFFDIGMTDKARFGIKSYKFIFHNPAGLNTYCYLFMLLHSVTLYKNGVLRKHSTLFTMIGILPWILTMRSRAITFSAIYLIIYLYIVYFRIEKKAYKFRWYQVLIFAGIAILLGWDAIEKYFIANERAARYQLMHSSIQLAKEYFPIGSGFGTFGTEASRAYYSPIYYRLGLSNIWGIGPGNTSFVTDQYWFGILGQFGVLGSIIMGFLIYQIYKKIWNIAKHEKGKTIAALTLFYTSIFASLTAGTFIQASIIPSILIFYLLNKNTSFRTVQK